MKRDVLIELADYNVLMSLVHNFKNYFADLKVHNKSIKVTQSYSDKHFAYQSPALSTEILYRKNRAMAFGNVLGEDIQDSKILDIEGLMLEYRVQLNVYSNTRGENHKWCSILDDVLFECESGIPLNTYNDNGTVKQSAVGQIKYNMDDIRNNNLVPNVISSDFHTIYEIKMNVIQQYTISYDIAEIENIVGKLK